MEHVLESSPGLDNGLFSLRIANSVQELILDSSIPPPVDCSGGAVVETGCPSAVGESEKVLFPPDMALVTVITQAMTMMIIVKKTGMKKGDVANLNHVELLP